MNFVSSADLRVVLDSPSPKSLMHIMKRIGPSTESCETSLVPSEHSPFTTTLCALPLKQTL